MMEIAVVLLIFIASYFLVLKNFKYSIYVLMVLSVFLHKELFSFYRWDLLPVRAFMLSLLCVLITKAYIVVILKKYKIKFSNLYKDPFILLFFILWLINGISIIFSENIQQSLLLYGFFTTVFVLFGFMYFNLKENSEDSLKYLRFYTYVAFVLSLFGYVQIYIYEKTGKIIAALWNIPGNIPRVGSTFWDVNHYAGFLAALLPLLGVLILIDRGKKKKAMDIFMFISMSAALLLTNSRSGWISAFITFLVFLTVLLVRKVGLKGIMYVVLALFLISLPFIREYSIKSSPFRAKVKQYFHYRLDSFDSHFLLLTGTYQVFEKYPLLGGGYGSFFEHFSKTKIAPTYFGRDPAALNTRVPAHTIWGELLSETGIMGLSAYIALFGSAEILLLYHVFKSKDKKTILISSVMFSTIIGWLTAGIFYSYNSEFFWIIMSLFICWAVAVKGKNTGMMEIYRDFFSSNKVIFGFISVLAALLIFVGLGTNSLIPWDEAIYAKIAKNMVVNNNYLVQTWNPGVVWYEKPPLYMWMMAGLMKLIGINSWAARLPSAIFGYLLVLFTYLFTKRKFGKTAGFMSAFILLTTTQFLYYTRASMLDVTTTFFITCSLYVYFINKEKNKNSLWLLIGLLIGLGAMVKGVIGLLPIPIIIIYELYLFIFEKKKPNKSLLKTTVLIGLPLLSVLLPWHILMYKQFGLAFIQNYIIYHVWDRATTSVEHKTEPFYWYVIVLKVSMRIWFIGLLLSGFNILKNVARKNRAFVFLSIWASFIFLFFSVSNSKLVWYIIPIYPVLAILTGVSLSTIFNWFLYKISEKNRYLYRIIFLYVFIISSLFYLFMNRNLVYTSDLTGSQARLLQLKDIELGISDIIYVDRIERPLVMFYSDSPYEIIDFSAEKNRVPKVSYKERMVLLTKAGRYNDTVPGKDYLPKIISKDGDYILWYFESEYNVDQSNLKNINQQISSFTNLSTPMTLEQISTLRNLRIQQTALTAKIQERLGN